MYFFYTMLYAIALVFLMPVEYLKRPVELRRRWLRERFGVYSPGQFRVNESSLWIHAVSVGEVIAAVPLVRKLAAGYPDRRIVVSTVTDTGQKVARERIGGQARIVYVPFDLPFAIRKALATLHPSLLIIMETELWPNLIRILDNRGVPVLLINGRISENSFQGYRKIRFFLQGILKRVHVFCMQNEEYAERIRVMGADPDRIRVTGSLKFDTRPSSPVPEWTRILDGPVIVAGSTHRSEEDLILDTYMKLTAEFPRLNLILAPRHPERFAEVEDLVRKRGAACVKRSELPSSPEGDSSPIMHRSSLIIVLDVMGELGSVYGVADIAIMGGSFITRGGQNPLEPAYWSKAIVCGPHMENFPFIAEFYRKGGAAAVSADTLFRTLRDLLNSPEKASSMGRRAKELYEENSGAADRALKTIAEYL